MEKSPLTPESRFSDRVANYVRYRPGYPEGTLDILRREAGLSSEATVADIGSGTGISTAVLLKSGAEVYAVEPNQAMREAAESQLGSDPRFHSIDGTATATTLPAQSVDLVTAFQSYHWFPGIETRLEVDRILRPGGKVALIWNVRMLDTSFFLRQYEEILTTFGTDYAGVRHENVHRSGLGDFFKGGRCEPFFLANKQSFDFEGLKGRLLSSSYVPNAGHPWYPDMIRKLEEIFARHQTDGLVSIEYDTLFYIGH